MNYPVHDDAHFEHCPWLFAAEASAEQRAAQSRHQAALTACATTEIGGRCFVAPSAAVYPDHLVLGPDSSWIHSWASAAHWNLGLGAAPAAALAGRTRLRLRPRPRQHRTRARAGTSGY